MKLVIDMKCEVCNDEAEEGAALCGHCAVDAQTGSKSKKKYVYNKTHMNRLLWLRDMRAELRR